MDNANGTGPGCPLGLEKSPQGIGTILTKLDFPRGLVSTQLYLAVLKSSAVRSPVGTGVKILPIERDVFGDRFGAQVPILVHMERCAALKEDTRTRLSCAGECDGCRLVGEQRLKGELQRIRNIVI